MTKRLLPIERQAIEFERAVSALIDQAAQPRATIGDLSRALRDQIERMARAQTLDAVQVARLSLALDRLDRMKQRRKMREPDKPNRAARTADELAAIKTRISDRIRALRDKGLL